MSTPPENPPAEARVLPRRWLAWVWVVPIAAALLVAWLAWDTIAARGPLITITFKVTQALQPGQTRIQHRGVDVGTVESVELTPDLSRVLVHSRMTRAAAPYLTDATRFYIVVPRLGFGGVSGLTTIVSGIYIEMYPGERGAPRRDFIGLDEPPLLAPDAPGTSFVLRAPDLGSVTGGAPLTYNGVAVGEVQGYSLGADGRSVTLTTFVRAPYDRLVHPGTRFWNVSGVDVSIGPQGVRLRTGPWQALVLGGIAFDNPAEGQHEPMSRPGTEFPLYASREAALRAQKNPGLMCAADFSGNLRGLGLGSPVELQGIEVGEVQQARLRYEPGKRGLITRVIFSIDPSKVQIEGLPGGGTSGMQALSGALAHLVTRGLRAQVTEASLIIGTKLVALSMVEEAPPGRFTRSGGLVQIPTAPSGDLTDLLARARELVSHLDHATAGPELKSSLRSLDHTLARLDTLTQTVGPDLAALIAGLRRTADAASGTLTKVQGLVGGDVPADSDLPQLILEVTRAARSVRELADYLERHPEALLRGRGKDGP